MATVYSSKWLKVSEPFPHVLHIELSRPPVNAFSVEFWSDYGRLFDSLTRDGYDVRAAVLSSALPKTFTAGIDIAEASGINGLAQGKDAARTALQTSKYLSEFQHAICAPERTPFPVIVALHGHVIGLGIDLIGPCDIRYAASNASFSIKEVDIGLAPDIGSLAFLPKITGNHSLVRELTYSARSFSANEAQTLGLISKVIDGGREEVIREALDLARLIATKSPVAVASAKHLITHSRDHAVGENLSYTTVWNSAALMTKDIGKAVARKQIPTFAALKERERLSKL